MDGTRTCGSMSIRCVRLFLVAVLIVVCRVPYAVRRMPYARGQAWAEEEGNLAAAPLYSHSKHKRGGWSYLTCFSHPFPARMALVALCCASLRRPWLFALLPPTSVPNRPPQLSSAHVYLRLPDGVTIDTIDAGVLEDCAQLVKHNSIEGNRTNGVIIVYTGWANLKKSGDMATGQVGFHGHKAVHRTRVDKRDNAIVNRLNKTKAERFPDLAEEKESYERGLARAVRVVRFWLWGCGRGARLQGCGGRGAAGATPWVPVGGLLRARLGVSAGATGFMPWPWDSRNWRGVWALRRYGAMCVSAESGWPHACHAPTCKVED